MKWKRERKRIYKQIKNMCLPIISTLLPPNTLVCKYLIITSKCKCSSISTTTLWCPIILTIAFFLWFAVHAHGRILSPPPPKNSTLLGFLFVIFLIFWLHHFFLFSTIFTGSRWGNQSACYSLKRYDTTIDFGPHVPVHQGVSNATSPDLQARI